METSRSPAPQGPVLRPSPSRPVASALPPSPDLDDDFGEAFARAGRPSRPSEAPRRGWLGLLGASAVAGALWLGGGRTGGDERSAAAWRDHVAPLDAAFRSDPSRPIRRVAADGSVATTDAFVVAAADLDREATRRINLAMARGDRAGAGAVLASAQAIPEAPAAQADRAEAARATLTAGEHLRPGGGVYRLHLFDSCDEDGDVVEVRLDGVPFAVVPITHAGATLAVPIDPARASRVSILGLRDGEGGITVGCRTADGSSYCRTIAEGGEQTVGIAAP